MNPQFPWFLWLILAFYIVITLLFALPSMTNSVSYKNSLKCFIKYALIMTVGSIAITLLYGKIMG